MSCFLKVKVMSNIKVRMSFDDNLLNYHLKNIDKIIIAKISKVRNEKTHRNEKLI